MKAAITLAIQEKPRKSEDRLDLWPFVRQMRDENRSNAHRSAKQSLPVDMCA
jgi:hypothetical protein